jgi:ribulose-phosphate 3-epimerase
MTDIIPAIIPESFEDLQEKMSLVNGLTHLVQIDVCDGKFVPSKCWPYVGDHEGAFRSITEEEQGFPFWESLDFEVDLMVAQPERVVEDWIRAGAKRLVIHLESSKNIKDLIKDLREKYGWYGDSPLVVEIGLAVNMNTPNEEIFEYLDPNTDGRSLVDFVQFMGIREIGFQGQLFDERVLAKIRELRHMYPDTIISVDGGVTLENAHDIVEAGVNRLISGSAIYESGDIKEVIENMRNA